MTLWEEPQWTDAWPLRCEVESQFTGNRGVVVAISPGRHLLVQWNRTERWEPYTVRHSSAQGLRRVEDA